MDFILPIDIVHIIFEESNFIIKLRLLEVCKYFSETLSITDLSNIKFNHSYKLNENILRQKKYLQITNLDVLNSRISDISYLTNLKYLRCLSSYNLINQKSIQNLNLITLIANNNSNITDISHMTNLQNLSAEGCCGIMQKSMENLNLQTLSLTDNKTIINISHITNLHTLKIEGTNCAIGQDSLINLNLTELWCSGNNRIYNINNMTNLKKLVSMSSISNITDSSIKNLDLIELYLPFNRNIHNFGHFYNLQILDVSDNPNVISIPKSLIKLIAKGANCSVSQELIEGLDLIELNICQNSKITNIMHLTRLEILETSYCIVNIPQSVKKLSACGTDNSVTQESIKNLNLTEFYVSYNPNINDLRHMTNLKVLSACGDTCGITKKSIHGLCLQKIYSYGNSALS